MSRQDRDFESHRSAFERPGQRRRGSHPDVKRGRGRRRARRQGVASIEKLGRTDPCPCESASEIRGLLPQLGSLLMGTSTAAAGWR